MNNLIVNLLCDLNFWSALLGFLGTILIFFFGFPPRVDQGGECYLVTGEIDEDEKKKALSFKLKSYIGLSLIASSFVMQLINSIFK